MNKQIKYTILNSLKSSQDNSDAENARIERIKDIIIDGELDKLTTEDQATIELTTGLNIF